MPNKNWRYTKLDPLADLVCQSLIGQSDDDISQCKEAAIVLINAPSGKQSRHCKDHANERFLGLPPMFSQATTAINYEYADPTDDRLHGSGIWKDTNGADLHIGDLVRYGVYPDGKDIPAIVTQDGFEAQGEWAERFDSQGVSRTCYFGTEHEAYLVDRT